MFLAAPAPCVHLGRFAARAPLLFFKADRAPSRVARSLCAAAAGTGDGVGKLAAFAKHHDEARSAVPATSIVVCWLRALESRKSQDERLILDPFAAKLCGAGKPDLTLIDESGYPLELWVDLVAVRTRWLDDALTAASVQQLVILASGLDARAWRMASLHGVPVFEVDFPEVLDGKKAVLDGEKAIALVQQVSANLSVDGWVDKLVESGFVQRHASTWLLEGLTGYLTSSELDGLFQAVSTSAGPGSSLFATFTGRGAGHTTQMHRSIWQDTLHVRAFLAKYGWAAEVSSFKDVAAGYGRGGNIPEHFEYFFVAASRNA